MLASSKFAQASAGRNTVREVIPVSNGSEKIRIHMVLCP